MKKIYIKPESIIVEIQTDYCMQHFSSARVINSDSDNDNDYEDIEIVDGVPDKW